MKGVKDKDFTVKPLCSEARMSKMDQLRALREDAEQSALKRPRSAATPVPEKLAAPIHSPDKPKFDRTAYQKAYIREYMRRRRARLRAEKGKVKP